MGQAYMSAPLEMVGQALPAGQAVQLVWLPSEYVPAVHTTGAEFCVGHSWPVGQAVHEVERSRL